MVNSLVVTDRDSIITTANDACCQLLGYAREELLGKPAGSDLRGGAAEPVPPRVRVVEPLPDHGQRHGRGDLAEDQERRRRFR